MRLRLEAAEAVVDGGQDFPGFFEEDGEQFGVNLLGAGLGQLQRRGRGRRRDGGLRLERGHDLIDLRRGFAGIEGVEHRAGLFAELGVGDKVGVFLERRQVLAHFFAQALIVRLFDQRFEQGGGGLFLLFDLGFDRGLGFFGFGTGRFVGRRGADAAHEGVVVVGAFAAVLQGVDEETEKRELAGDGFEIRFLRRVGRVGEALYGFAAVAQGSHRAVLAHDGQRATDLA